MNFYILRPDIFPALFSEMILYARFRIIISNSLYLGSLNTLPLVSCQLELRVRKDYKYQNNAH